MSTTDDDARRALVAGVDPDEIADLARGARDVLGNECEWFAMEVDATSTDPALAWGTARPVVRTLSIEDEDEDEDGDGDEDADGDEPPSIAMSTGVHRPLGANGDTAPAILDAAHHVGADVIVTAVRPQGWFARVFAGSAPGDLLQTSAIPVLMINLAVDGDETAG